MSRRWNAKLEVLGPNSSNLARAVKLYLACDPSMCFVYSDPVRWVFLLLQLMLWLNHYRLVNSLQCHPKLLYRAYPDFIRLSNGHPSLPRPIQGYAHWRLAFREIRGRSLLHRHWVLCLHLCDLYVPSQHASHRTEYE